MIMMKLIDAGEFWQLVNFYRFFGWLPPECLPNQSQGNERVPYSLSSMIYTFGLVIWSMYHAAVLPFEDEKAREIQSAAYRIKKMPSCDEGFMPNEIIGVSNYLDFLTFVLDYSKLLE
jgi:hypothetical protein